MCTNHRCNPSSWCRCAWADTGWNRLTVSHLPSDMRKPHRAYVTVTWQYLATLDTTGCSSFCFGLIKISFWVN
jgi:hypothetical protein